MDKKQVIGAALIGLALGAGSVGLHDVLEQPEIVKETVYVNQTVEVPVVKEVNVTKEVEVEVEKIVEVDNGNLQLVIEDYEGEELDEDEIQEIVDEVLFKNEVTILAERLVEKELVEFMDDEDIFGDGVFDGYRDDDVYSVSVDEDETTIEDVDYEDRDATVYVEAKLKLEDDGDKLRQKVLAEVEVKDNELEIVNVEILE